MGAAIVGDVDGENEFCAQHSATLSGSGALLLFDNGNLCNGSRKDLTRFSRAVEYQLVITDTRKEAVFRRQFRLPANHGYASTRGSAVELPNGNWLIAWGTLRAATVPYDRSRSISEVDPDSGVSVLNINMHWQSDMKLAHTYRVYRESEANVDIPLNLP